VQDEAKRQRLEAEGWKIGTVAEFLELTSEESALVEIKLALSQNLRERREKQMTEKSTANQFKRLMNTIAEGWNEGNARKAADCFTEDAIYVEPPDRQVYSGRTALYDFFGGEEKPDPPMKMRWHHLAFDEASQIGFGEYTFQMNRRYHGIVVVRVREGKISNWREYQYQSEMEWEEFSERNRF